MNLPVNYNKLTSSQRRDVRGQYALLQEGLCHHCGKPLNGKPSKKVSKKPVDKSLFPTGFFK